MTIRIIDEIKSGRWFSLEDYPMEKWADVVDYEGIYMISNYGRLKHLSYSIYGLNADRIDVETKIRKPNLMNKGYYCYELWKNNKRKVYLLHRLLAIAFIPNPNNLPQINHKDGDKRNNNISNLEWCTAKENTVHAFRVLGRVSPQKGRCGKDCCHSKPVCALNKNGEVIMVFESMQEAYRQTGIMESGISSCINGKQKTAGGFLWKLWLDRPKENKSRMTVDGDAPMRIGTEPLAIIRRIEK